MSLLLGGPGDRLSLSEAIDSLASAARAAGRPTLAWLAGMLYPSYEIFWGIAVLSYALVDASSAVGAIDVEDLVAVTTNSFPRGLSGNLGSVVVMTAIAMRLIPGLAAAMETRAWRREHEGERPSAPSLSEVVRSGKGLGFSTLGLLGLSQVLIVVATVVVIGPFSAAVAAFELDSVEGVVLALMLPLLAVLMLYSIALQVLLQLALHSLATNRRGVGSALTHAWRLVNRSPRATVRAAMVDACLWVSIWTLVVIAQVVLGRIVPPFGMLVLTIALIGFGGLTRAGFWAHAYRSLGGLTPADGVPGLPPTGPAVVGDARG